MVSVLVSHRLAPAGRPPVSRAGAACPGSCPSSKLLRVSAATLWLAAASLAATSPARAQAPPEVAQGQAERIDLGRPSVLSQRGQRLKVAIPYGSAPGAPVSPVRIWVAAVDVPDGEIKPDARAFTVLRPQRRNIVIVQSREPVTASRLTLTLRVAGQDDAPTFDLEVPPIRFAAPERAETTPVARPSVRR